MPFQKNLASDMPVDEVRTKMKAHFEGAADRANSKWDDLWGENFMPWDRGVSNPALEDTLISKKELIPSAMEGSAPRRKALVPGCGRGYDVLLLSSFGYNAFGLEVSDKALDACRTFEKSDGNRYTARDESIGKGSVNWVHGDFFANDWNPNDTYDVIYDYTFLAAMHPTKRAALALRYQQLLAPGGTLICLEFPTNKPMSTGGPPFGLPEKVYIGHFGRPGEDMPYDDIYELDESKLKGPSEKALVRVDRWLAEHTHPIGAGNDYVSLWKH
jgi:hypothetical protein